MALFNRLTPYSNLHDINLDWIISIIKSIDPAVIKALQNLTPEFIKQINNKVNEAQIAATSAQTSASEANTAKENAATSATEAAQKATEASASAATANNEAVRADNAANRAEATIANALNPEFISMTAVDSYVEGSTIAQCKVSGKSAVINIDCMMTGTKSNEYWTPIYTLGKAVSGTFFGWGYLDGSTLVKAKVENTSVYLESGTITKRESLRLFNVSFITM